MHLLFKVRASNLQELVYKNGQAGVSKATVSITFENLDKQQSPLGYEHFDEIVVTRQVCYKKYVVPHRWMSLVFLLIFFTF